MFVSNKIYCIVCSIDGKENFVIKKNQRAARWMNMGGNVRLQQQPFILNNNSFQTEIIPGNW